MTIQWNHGDKAGSTHSRKIELMGSTALEQMNIRIAAMQFKQGLRTQVLVK